MSQILDPGSTVTSQSFFTTESTPFCGKVPDGYELDWIYSPFTADLDDPEIAIFSETGYTGIPTVVTKKNESFSVRLECKLYMIYVIQSWTAFTGLDFTGDSLCLEVDTFDLSFELGY